MAGRHDSPLETRTAPEGTPERVAGFEWSLAAYVNQYLEMGAAERMQFVGVVLYTESERIGVEHPFFAPTVLDGGLSKFTTSVAAFCRSEKV